MLGFEEKYRLDILLYLSQEGLIKEDGGGVFTTARLEHRGIVEIEEALSNPSQPTEHFPAINVFINNIAGISQSSIQIGNQNTASLQIASESDKHAYETLIPLLHQFLQELDSEREERAELEAEVQTLEVQLKSPKPKSKILELALQGIKELFVGMGKEAMKDSGLHTIIQQVSQLLGV